jgi:hypothetical protein
MARPVKTVALVDWHWDGHHPTYFKFFASVLAERGIRVVPLLPAPEEAAALVATTPAARSPEAVRRIEPAEVFRGGAHLPVRPRSLQRLLRQASMFRGLAARLRSWERRHGTPVDLVFFDTMYDHDFASASRLSAMFGWDWAGLYLHARCIHTPGAVMADGGRVPDGRKMFRGRRFRGLGVLDEGAIPGLEPILGDRRIVRFPDITDATLPATDGRDAGLARKIESYAGGRPIVALVGHLHRSKGLEAFTAAARDPRLAGHFFLLGGAANLAGLDPIARREVTKTWEAAANVHAHLQRIDEAALNAVIRASRVLFAAYVDFPHSSNILTKAAVFRRPVVVSEGHLMAERVRRHGMGLTVGQDDVEGIVQAILRLSAPAVADAGRPEPRWDEYAALHSYDRLGAAFAELVS